MGDPRPQRLVFGGVAERYARFRPGYPAALFDELVRLTAATGPALRAVEIGAGTGKATVELASRGLAVDAVEPDPLMAAEGRRCCAHLPGVSFHVADFERFDPAPGGSDLVCAAQSWHWVRAEEALPVAREALRPGGVFAVFWNSGEVADPRLRAELDEAYRRQAPELEQGPVDRSARECAERIDALGLFPPLAQATFAHSVSLSTADYLGNLGTHSDHVLLPAHRRQALLADVGAVCDRHGGRAVVDYRTELYWTRAPA